MSGLVLSWSNRKFQHKQEVPKLWQKVTSLPPRNEKYPLFTITMYIFKLTLSTSHKRKSKNIVSNWRNLNTSLSMFPVYSTVIFLIMPHVLLFWDRCLCPHCAAIMRPAPLLAWPRSGDTLPPILTLASLTNPQPCCLINHCRNCRCYVGTV